MKPTKNLLKWTVVLGIGFSLAGCGVPETRVITVPSVKVVKVTTTVTAPAPSRTADPCEDISDLVSKLNSSRTLMGQNSGDLLIASDRVMQGSIMRDHVLMNEQIQIIRDARSGLSDELLVQQETLDRLQELLKSCQP